MRPVNARLVAAGTIAALVLIFVCAVSVRAQKLPVQPSLLRVEQTPSSVFFGPLLHVGASLPTNAAPAAYGVVPSMAWSAGVELSYKITEKFYFGTDLFYAKRSWEMSAGNHRYDELALDYAAASPYLRYDWAIAGVAFLFPCATQAEIGAGSDPPKFIQLDLRQMHLGLRCGYSMHLFGDEEQEFRGVALVTYGLNNVFKDWHLLSAPEESGSINGRMFSVQVGVNCSLGVYP
jgi:hypothetical protein